MTQPGPAFIRYGHTQRKPLPVIRPLLPQSRQFSRSSHQVFPVFHGLFSSHQNFIGIQTKWSPVVCCRLSGKSCCNRRSSVTATQYRTIPHQSVGPASRIFILSRNTIKTTRWRFIYHIVLPNESLEPLIHLARDADALFTSNPANWGVLAVAPSRRRVCRPVPGLELI